VRDVARQQAAVSDEPGGRNSQAEGPARRGARVSRLAAVRAAIRRSGQEPGQAHACSYLAGRMSRELAFGIDGLEPGQYTVLMDLNFRRSGPIVYRPACAGCRECRAIRVPVRDFRPDRSQRRCRQRNRDVVVEVGAPALTREKHELYAKYLRQRHDHQMRDSWADLAAFLYESPILTQEVVYRWGGRLAAVGILDVEPQALSTVYCFYDPDMQGHSPGTFNVLWTIDYALRKGIPYVYLGYYVRGCGKMNYKLNFRPCELLNPDGTWERVECE
jgi:arginyl-tRNA--protein-N-Asp/Glu arginylyltransferase